VLYESKETGYVGAFLIVGLNIVITILKKEFL
jgi:hypothetical protein